MKLGKIHNPLPQSLQEDLNKCTHIIQKFTKKELTNDSLSKVIPPDIIRNAKGICIMTVVKAGFVFSGRAGTGLVVARVPGGWSAPSAIGTAGMGFGGQIGAEVTDFVIILNTDAAVKAFSMGGNVTLGGNLSVSAGPFGRSAEAAGTMGQLAPIFSYSKSKGLFAGISIEGSVIVERKDANNIFYGRKMSPREILSGSVVPPPICQPLYDALNKQSEEVFTGSANTNNYNYQQQGQSHYGNTPSNGNVYHGQSLPRYQNEPVLPVKPKFSNDHYKPLNDTQYESSNQYLNRAEGKYENNSTARRYSNRYSTGNQSTTRYQSSTLPPETSGDGKFVTENEFGDFTAPPKPSKPIPPKRLPIATAMYKFKGERQTDLSLEVGDIITVLNNDHDWWRGRVGKREGDFPANYVRLEE